jgi:RHS repeat-associated protein
VVFVQMDQQTIADYPVGGAATTPTFRYVYASYIDEPVVRKGPTSTSTVHFYHRNQQYSVTAITTSTGAIAERYAYTAYGQPTILNASGTVISATTLSNRYTYTGREWDATLGLHHFRARWMSGLTGRFLTRDPIGYEGSMWGLYEYVQGMTLMRLDPLGLNSKCCVKDFNAPEGPQDPNLCTITQDPKGNAYLRFNFDTKASFDDHDHKKECCCHCCSYRQYVRGGFKVKITHSGGAALNPPIDVSVPGDRWDDDFVEDCENGVCYGHRGKDFENSKYPDKCSFSSKDPAGMPVTTITKIALRQNPGLRRPITIEFCIELDFKGVVIDTCNGNLEKQSKVAEVRCCQTFTIP